MLIDHGADLDHAADSKITPRKMALTSKDRLIRDLVNPRLVCLSYSYYYSN